MTEQEIKGIEESFEGVEIPFSLHLHIRNLIAEARGSRERESHAVAPVPAITPRTTLLAQMAATIAAGYIADGTTLLHDEVNRRIAAIECTALAERILAEVEQRGEDGQ